MMSGKAKSRQEIVVLGFTTLVFLDIVRNRMVGKVPVSGSPFGIAVNPRTKRIYITTLDANRLLVVDAVKRRLLTSIPAGIEPGGVAIDERANRIYVANGGSDSLSVISGSTNRVLRTLSIPAGPEAVAVNPRTNRIYVTHPGYGVTVIDGNRFRVAGWIPIRDKSDLNSVVVDPILNRIIVTNPYQNTITVVDGKRSRVLRSVRVGKMPSGVVADLYRNILYVANSDGNSISIIDIRSSKPLGTLRVQKPSQIAIDPKNRRLAVIGQGGSLLLIFHLDTHKLLSRRPLSEEPIGLAFLDG